MQSTDFPIKHRTISINFSLQLPPLSVLHTPSHSDPSLSAFIQYFLHCRMAFVLSDYICDNWAIWPGQHYHIYSHLLITLTVPGTSIWHFTFSMWYFLHVLDLQWVHIKYMHAPQVKANIGILCLPRLP